MYLALPPECVPSSFFYVDLYVYIESMSLRIVGSTVQALTQQHYWKITR